MTVHSKCWKEWAGCQATANSERQMCASQYNEETLTRGTGNDCVGYREKFSHMTRMKPARILPM